MVCISISDFDRFRQSAIVRNSIKSNFPFTELLHIKGNYFNFLSSKDTIGFFKGITARHALSQKRIVRLT